MGKSKGFLGVEILNPVKKVIRFWPSKVKIELGAVLLRLQERQYVGMPDIKAIPDIVKGAFEIRLSSSEGAYRVFFKYTAEFILIFHAFVKKSQKTSRLEVNVARLRIQNYRRDH